MSQERISAVLASSSTATDIGTKTIATVPNAHASSTTGEETLLSKEPTSVQLASAVTTSENQTTAAEKVTTASVAPDVFISVAGSKRLLPKEQAHAPSPTAPAKEAGTTPTLSKGVAPSVQAPETLLSKERTSAVSTSVPAPS